MSIIKAARESCGQSLTCCQIFDRRCSKECLAERTLRVSVDQQCSQATFTQASAKVKARRTLAAAAFLVDECNDHVPPLRVGFAAELPLAIPSYSVVITQETVPRIGKGRNNEVLSVSAELWYENRRTNIRSTANETTTLTDNRLRTTDSG